MSWYRKYPLFATGLTVCGLVLLGELAFIYERFDASRNAAKRLEQRKGELAAIEQIAPPPTREVAAAIEADLAKAQKSLASMHTELTGKGPAAEKIRTAKVPAARTDSFFDLATFMEKMREQAEKNGVEVRPEAARFGFAKYANEGPEMDRIEPVFRQRQIAEYLLESLFEAKPRALFAVKRERTQTKAEREARAAAEAAGTPAEEVPADSDSESPDYFIIDPRQGLPRHHAIPLRLHRADSDAAKLPESSRRLRTAGAGARGRGRFRHCRGSGVQRRQRGNRQRHDCRQCGGTGARRLGRAHRRSCCGESRRRETDGRTTDGGHQPDRLQVALEVHGHGRARRHRGPRGDLGGGTRAQSHAHLMSHRITLPRLSALES
jgi:hypothetical protein